MHETGIPTSSVVIWAVTAASCLFCGYKMGYWATMGCIHNVCDELRKQLDIDGKPFEQNDNYGDFDDDDDDFYQDPDFWKDPK